LIGSEDLHGLHRNAGLADIQNEAGIFVGKLDVRERVNLCAAVGSAFRNPAKILTVLGPVMHSASYGRTE